MMRLKNRTRMMFAITFIMLAFPGFGQPPQVWSRLTQPPYPYLQTSVDCDKTVKQQPLFEVRPVLGQDVIVDVQLFPFHPGALLVGSDAEREVALLSRSCWCIVLFSKLVSSKITTRKRKSPRNCNDNGSFAGTNKILQALSRWLCNKSEVLVVGNSRLWLSCASIWLVQSDRFRPVPLLLIRTVGSDRKFVPTK